MITGMRGLCNGLGPAVFGLIFYLFHVDLNEDEARLNAADQLGAGPPPHNHVNIDASSANMTVDLQEHPLLTHSSIKQIPVCYHSFDYIFCNLSLTMSYLFNSLCQALPLSLGH